MDVTVVIVSYNVEDLLRGCLASIRTQTACSHEVIVVDNASSDGSASMVRNRHPEVTLMENRENKGFAGANNQAIARARGRYVLLLNPDTLILDGAIDRLLRFMEQHPEAGACGPRNVSPDGSLQHNCHRFPTLGLRFIEHLQLARLYPRHLLWGREHFTHWNYETVRDVDWITGCSLLIRTRALNQIGLLDERFFIYSEEVDLCYRLKQRGWKILFCPEASVVHYGGQSALQQTRERVFSKSILTRLFQARYLFFLKHYGRARYLALRGLDLTYFSLVYLKNLLRTDEDTRNRKLDEYGTVLRYVAFPKMPHGKGP